MEIKFLLDRPEYTFKINNVTCKAKETYKNCTPDTNWEMVKCIIIAASIDFSTRLARSTRFNINVLHEKLAEIQDALTQASKSVELKQTFMQINNEVEDLVAANISYLFSCFWVTSRVQSLAAFLC